MNLFIGGHFFNTVGNKIDIMQLIRLIAEDEDIIQAEVLEVLEREYGEEGEGNNFFEIQDDVLYCDPEATRLAFDDLFDGDYEETISRITAAIENHQGGVLKLQSNGSEELQAAPAEVQKELDLPQPAFTPPTAPANPAAAIFDTEPEWVGKAAAIFDEPKSQPLTSRNLPNLNFNGQFIGVRQNEFGEVLFDVAALYYAAYGIQHNPDYLYPLLSRRRLDLINNEDDIHVDGPRLYVGTNALGVLHADLAPAVEWHPIVSLIVNTYEDCLNTENAVWETIALDVFGNLK